MQLSKATVEVMKSFSAINSNLVVKAGSKIETMSAGKDIMAEYKSDDTFDKTMSIFNMNEFLGVLSAFDKPELTLGANSVAIKQGKQSVEYVYAEAKLLVVPPEKGINFPVSDVSFKLPETTLTKLTKMSAVLSAPDLAVIGDGKTTTLRLFDKKNPSCNVFELDTEIATTDEFQINFKMETLKLIAGNYTVDISSKKISRFTNDSMPLLYYVAVEADSTFAV